MTITPPAMRSLLSQPVTANNFIAMQSVQLAVSNAGVTGSASVTFTDIVSMGRVTMKITNSGSKGCYVASGHTTATAVVSSATPTPTTGAGAVATCDYIAAGSIITQDYVAGTDTIAAICAGTDTTTLEISIGAGQ